MAVGAFAGVEIAASVNGVPLGDDALAPFWAAAEATGALVFIHPTTRGSSGAGSTTTTSGTSSATRWRRRSPRRTSCSRGRDGAPSRACGSCSPTAAARCSRCAARLRHGWAAIAPARTRLSEPPEDSLRRFLYDTVMHDAGRAARARRVRRRRPRPARLRPPLRHGRPAPGRHRRARPASTPEAEAAILGGNAARPLGLEVHR